MSCTSGHNHTWKDFSENRWSKSYKDSSNPNQKIITCPPKILIPSRMVFRGKLSHQKGKCWACVWASICELRRFWYSHYCRLQSQTPSSVLHWVLTASARGCLGPFQEPEVLFGLFRENEMLFVLAG